MSDLPDNPMSNVEKYLSVLAGEATELPAHPQSRVEQYLAYIAENGGAGGSGSSGTTYEPATFESDGLMSASDKQKLDNIEAQAQKNTITGIKGNNESSYRTGNINITPENIGAADATQTDNQIQLLRELIAGIDAPMYRSAGPDNPVVLSDGYAAPVRELSVNIPVTQSGSGDPSPDNIRPISGFDSVTVTRTGKNLIHITNPAYIRPNGLTILKDTPEPGAFTVSGTNESAGYVYIATVFDLPPGDYILTGCPKNGRTGGWSQVVRTYRNNAVYKSYLDYGDGVSFRVEEADEKIELLTGRFTTGAVADNLVFRPMIRLASAADSAFDYAEPVIISVSMDEAGPVCGGNLNLTTGVLTLTHGNMASYNGESLPGAWLSDRDVYAENTVPTIGAQVVYQLETPVTYQLTPAEITTLAGNNTIFSNAGKINVIYRADPALSM